MAGKHILSSLSYLVAVKTIVYKLTSYFRGENKNLKSRFSLCHCRLTAGGWIIPTGPDLRKNQNQNKNPPDFRNFGILDMSNWPHLLPGPQSKLLQHISHRTFFTEKMNRNGSNCNAPLTHYPYHIDSFSTAVTKHSLLANWLLSLLSIFSQALKFRLLDLGFRWSLPLCRWPMQHLKPVI